VVTSTTPSELTLLHELAHFIGGMDHGPRFREVYVGLLGRFVSAPPARRLQLALTARRNIGLI
jgi:predicted metal-dependent hydrolase